MSQSIGHAYPWTFYDCNPGTGWTLVAYADGARRALWVQNQSDTDMYLTVGNSDTVAPNAGQAGMLLKAAGANQFGDPGTPPFTRQSLWAKCSGSGKVLVIGLTSDNAILEPGAAVSSSSSSSSSVSGSSASSASSSTAQESSPSSVSASTASSRSASSLSSASSRSASSASSVHTQSMSPSSLSSLSTASSVSTSSYSSESSSSSSSTGP